MDRQDIAIIRKERQRFNFINIIQIITSTYKQDFVNKLHIY